MALDLLLVRCLVPGQTSLKESGLAVQLGPKGEETILLFRSDSPEFRSCFNLGSDARVSDAIFFYRSAQRPRPLLVFVELKGNDVGHAVKQLTATVRVVEQRLHGQLRKEVDLLAVVVTSGSAPSQKDPAFKRFKADIGISLRFKSAPRGKGSVDLRELLD